MEQKISEIKSLLQKSIEVLYKSQRYCEAMFPIAQRFGCQALKRRLRYHSAKDFALINCIRSKAYDLFCIQLDNAVHPVQINEPSSYQTLFNSVKEKSWGEYFELHELSNKLIVGCAKCFAHKLDEHIRCIENDMEQLKREMDEYSNVGYSAEYIMLRETSAENYHDELEKKENSL